MKSKKTIDPHKMPESLAGMYTGVVTELDRSYALSLIVKLGLDYSPELLERFAHHTMWGRVNTRLYFLFESNEKYPIQEWFLQQAREMALTPAFVEQ